MGRWSAAVAIDERGFEFSHPKPLRAVYRAHEAASIRQDPVEDRPWSAEQPLD